MSWRRIGVLAANQRASLDTVVSSHENNVAQRQNSDMRTISVYGALLAVPTVVAGLNSGSRSVPA